jgi:UDP-glucose 4-epimerase
LKVFGDNWPTPDGSCIRDYIHVIDVAEGHLAALESLKSCEEQVIQLNLGSGCGYSVLEVVQAFELVSKIRIPYVITEPRHGDAAITTADTSEAQRRLNWRARRGLHEICKDFWTWQRTNPKGYQP